MIVTLLAVHCACVAGEAHRVGMCSYPATTAGEVEVLPAPPPRGNLIGNVIGYGKTGPESIFLHSAEWDARCLAAEIGGHVIVPRSQGSTHLEGDILWWRRRDTLAADVYRLSE